LINMPYLHELLQRRGLAPGKKITVVDMPYRYRKGTNPNSETSRVPLLDERVIYEISSVSDLGEVYLKEINNSFWHGCFAAASSS